MTSLKELGDLVGGKVVGDPQLSIDGVSSLDTGEEGTITYLLKKSFKNLLKQQTLLRSLFLTKLLLVRKMES